MPTISNDARTVLFVEDSRGQFDIQPGGRSGTPTIEVPVINGNMIEVTCQFAVQSANPIQYEIKAVSGDSKRLTQRAANSASDTGGWQVAVRTDYFLITLPPNTGADDATFEVEFTGDSGALCNSFLLTAKLVGSLDIPA